MISITISSSSNKFQVFRFLEITNIWHKQAKDKNNPIPIWKEIKIVLAKHLQYFTIILEN